MKTRREITRILTHANLLTRSSKYVISGSDDTNLRVWKSRADEKIGQLTAREER